MDFHGGNIYKIFREKNIKEILDYSSNINPYGIPESLKKRITENLEILERYPDPDYVELRQKLSNLNKVNLSDIILGNGATEIIFLFMKVINPKKILIVSPTFGEYERAVKATEISGDTVDLSCSNGDNKNIENKKIEIEYFELKESDDFKLNIGNLKNELENKYDLLIICNPNNPTGKFLKLAQTEEILKECNKYNTKLFIDEAFIEFLEDGMKESIINTEGNKKNLFVTRAFTKFFAIPGLRLGYGMYFDKELEKKISEKKEPWSVNNFAEMAGLTVLDDAEYIEKTLKWIAEEKKYMYEKLNKISGMKVYETEVNFITGKIDEKLFSEGLNVKILREKMLEQGILIRDASNFKFLDERFFRLAIKDRASNERVIEVMKEIFREKGVKSFNE
ncbi:histidinol-phosphate transaminase [Leptotrichia sp. oral taxon 215]|uniref:pyridoxal phosphate-dependent aminotransferase n=1 Tax=Leptotrichia sp. oral taxon 215 TaxID=712359 RepID=UPI0004003C27|nr:histidinol-phosphate transaminase [Leptotrichia sp. oral taxon 215]